MTPIKTLLIEELLIIMLNTTELIEGVYCTVLVCH